MRKVINNLSSDLDDCSVVLQVDPEGNGYNPLKGVDENAVYHDDTVYSLRWSAEDCCLEENKWENIKNDKSKRVIIIYPS